MASGSMVSVFEPSAWSDFFLRYEPKPPQSEEWMKIRINKLKDDVDMLFKICSNSLERMKLVDAIQRLGIAHLFEIQIGTALCDIHENELNISSLREVALRFCHLREHVLWGILCLYNAAYMLTHGGPELEGAISLARHHLESLAPSLGSPLAEQVKHALHVPLPRTYRRLDALCYILEYEQEEGPNPILLELAKLEFNLLQAVHLKELKAISEWYSDRKGYVGLSFARDRVVECYLWGYCLNFLHTLLDDTNDVGATLEEYRKLDAAIQRWDGSAFSLVPGYLKKFYNKLLICFKEFDDELRLNGRYSIDHIKKEAAILGAPLGANGWRCSYVQEAEWLHKNHKPRFEDKLHLAAMSIGAVQLCVYTMVCMGDEMPKGALSGHLDTLMSIELVKLTETFMQPRNNRDVANCVECYANEHKVTEEVAFADIDSMIEDDQLHSQWVYYGDRKDAFTFSSHLEDIIESLFVNSIPIYSLRS
ncbi:hypothetical protein VPH35_026031 [Triticum aestivum]